MGAENIFRCGDPSDASGRIRRPIVKAYPDTSFLCALYIQQSTSVATIAYYQRMTGPLYVSALLLGEFRQSVRFQIFRHSRDSTQGYARKTGTEALANLQSNLDAGALVVTPAEWSDVLARAERISSQYTSNGGHRYLDILHVATALHLGVSEFLSFDVNQRKLASATGLSARP
jgi:predicted nucleic acid-binding protein